jgi:protein-L-isoaspartate(D-aspartate) O-methyltransferase
LPRGGVLKAKLDGLEAPSIPISALHVGIPSSADAERVWYQAPGFSLERESEAVEAAAPGA